MTACLIFPHQLFREHPALSGADHVILFEDPLFFRQVKFHKQKLLLHRASMKAYAHWLREQGNSIQYIETAVITSLRDLFQQLLKDDTRELNIIWPDDYLIN